MVNDTMIWMNSKMNQQSKQSFTQKPVVTIKEIQAKTKVLLLHYWSESFNDEGVCLQCSKSEQKSSNKTENGKLKNLSASLQLC